MISQDEDDDNWDDNDDGDDGDDDATVPCPYCHREMYEDSPWCPHCGQYISEEDVPFRRKSVLIILGTLLCFAVIAAWIIWFY
jgi:hypothetical protein